MCFCLLSKFSNADHSSQYATSRALREVQYFELAVGPALSRIETAMSIAAELKLPVGNRLGLPTRPARNRARLGSHFEIRLAAGGLVH